MKRTRGKASFNGGKAMTGRWGLKTVAGAVVVLAVAAASCGGNGGEKDVPTEVEDARTDETSHDIRQAADAPVDIEAKQRAPEEGLPVFGAFVQPPEESVLPEELTGCPVYRETTCEQGEERRCEIYDAAAGDWAEGSNPWVEQIFWYDRYYDRYHRMEGQQAEFYFVDAMPPGTPESEWASPDNFLRYSGHWDSSGWTGTALQAAASRFASTGTPADYGRMLDQLQVMMFMYEATGVPGLIMRCHYAMLEEGAPDPVGHPGKALIHYEPPDAWWCNNPLPQQFVDRLPAYYTEGVTIQGAHYSTTPRWMGGASRDMYVRSLPGIMLAYDLLGAGEAEDAVRAVIETEIPCTLKRMKKMRIRNVQQNEEIKAAVAAYLGADRLQLEPGDVDLTTLDTLYGYVLEQPRPDKPEFFTPQCPDSLPMEVDPAYDLDAADPQFILQFLNIGARLNKQGDLPIAWIQFPSARGSDVLFMTQWALAGHYLTGDDRFLDFLAQMMEELHYWEVVDTMGSFWLPKWCKPHYGPSLVYPTQWNIQNRVDRDQFPQYWNRLGTAIKEEFRFKELVDTNDAYFGVLYASMVDAGVDPDASAYADQMVELLRGTGQYQVEDPFEPRRSYNVDLLYDPPAGCNIKLEELTPELLEVCTKPIEVFGVTMEGKLHDENPRSVEGMPVPYRIAGPFQWQEDPFQAYRDYGADAARIQWPMSGFSVAYWTGRMQGTITDGTGTALAWRPTGEACR